MTFYNNSPWCKLEILPSFSGALLLIHYWQLQHVLIPLPCILFCFSFSICLDWTLSSFVLIQYNSYSWSPPRVRLFSSSLLQDFLFLIFCSLNIIRLEADFLVLILLDILRTSWICRLLSSTNIGKFSVITASHHLHREGANGDSPTLSPRVPPDTPWSCPHPVLHLAP